MISTMKISKTIFDQMKNKKIVYALFDGSGISVLDWAKAGHTCYCFNADEADHGEYFIKMEHPNIHYINIWIDESFHENINLPPPDIIFSFPSCTFTSGSGSKHERTDEEKSETLKLAKYVEWLGEEYYNCPWYVENPVGSLSTEWRKPNYYFHPYEFGGYLTNEEGSFHHHMPLRDGYTKKTCIWCGNGLVWPLKRPVAHCGYFWGWAKLGGKSTKTKVLRSLTPRGFARAIFKYNEEN